MLRKDLSNYFYARYKIEIPNMIAVGWLDQENDYPLATTKISTAITDRLRFFHKWYKFSANIVRGFTPCPVCSEYYDKNGLLLGHAELWIPFGGKIYAAPNFMLHYIEDHNYSPPAEYLNALLNADITLADSIEAFEDALWNGSVTEYIESDWIKNKSFA